MRKISVYLICRNMVKPDIVTVCCLKEIEGSFDVCFDEGRGVGDGIVIMTFCGKVNACICFAEELIYNVRIADIAMHKGESIRVA